jgi:hypothetical protein
MGNKIGSNASHGINVEFGVRCRVEGNHISVNGGNGIKTQSGGGKHLIIRNSSVGHATEYNIGSGNSMGPIVTQANIASNTNPSANYDLD